MPGSLLENNIIEKFFYRCIDIEDACGYIKCII